MYRSTTATMTNNCETTCTPIWQGHTISPVAITATRTILFRLKPEVGCVFAIYTSVGVHIRRPWYHDTKPEIVLPSHHHPFPQISTSLLALSKYTSHFTNLRKNDV